MNIKIIEPSGMFYDGDAHFLEFTAVTGRMGVYENHIPLTTILEPCVIKIHNGEEVKTAAIIGGFVEIQKDTSRSLRKMRTGRKRLTWNTQRPRNNVQKSGSRRRMQESISCVRKWP